MRFDGFPLQNWLSRWFQTSWALCGGGAKVNSEVGLVRHPEAENPWMRSGADSSSISGKLLSPSILGNGFDAAASAPWRSKESAKASLVLP